MIQRSFPFSSLIRLTRWYQQYGARQSVIWYLTTLVLVGIYSFGIVEGLARFILVLALGFFDYFLHRLHTPDFNQRPLSGVITALIVWLVLPFDVSFWILVPAILIALASKHYLIWDKRHIFNPAAFGLVVVGLLTETKFGWWGDTIPLLTFLLGLPIVWKVKKYYQVVGFLVAHAVLLILTGSEVFLPGAASQEILLAFDLSWFFVLGLLPEPMTSPPTPRGQVGFGVLVAVASIALAHIPFLANVSLPLALLGGNLVASYFRTQKGPALA